MNIFSSFFLAITSFLGFGNGTEMHTAPIEEKQEVAQVDDSSGSLIREILVKSKNEPGEINSLENLETKQNEESNNEISEMTGEAVGDEQKNMTSTSNIKTMMVAGGCFWCTEADLEKVHGVIEVVSGYAGGTTQNPTYSDYGKGGHREVAQVTYDSEQVSFEEVLIVTLKTTDPTDDNGTFGDRGDEYSSAFYYENSVQRDVIENLISEVDEFGPYDLPLAIDVEELPQFWPAEDYHQNYYKGTLTKLKYQYYRNASGRTKFIEKYWGVNDHSVKLQWREEKITKKVSSDKYMWSDYVKPSKDILKKQLDSLVYKVTQEDGTERSHTSELDKNWEPGIYVDVLSGEPLYSSKDKFDSGTGWPSFVKPITEASLTLQEDRKLFSVRTETRSAIADNHIGHVFNDGPSNRGGMRYCMNGAALKFVPKAEMEAEGYSDFLQFVE